MRPVHFLRRNPLVILGAFAVAFAVWVWRDAGPDVPEVIPYDGPARQLARPSTDVVMERFDAAPLRPEPHATAQVLPKLRPGMTRTEVEGIVGAPAAGDVSPATVADGRVTYRMTYEADLAPLNTVRRRGPGARPITPADCVLVALEFDATKPGHPLVGVHYPDPLF